MACVVSFKIVNSAGAAIPAATFSIQADTIIQASVNATQFNLPVLLTADGSGEGTVTLSPGAYTGISQIDTLLDGSRARRFSFRVPPGVGTASLWELIDADALVNPIYLLPDAWAAAIVLAVVQPFYSSLTLALAGTTNGQYFFVVTARNGVFLELWQKEAGAGRQVLPQIGGLDE